MWDRCASLQPQWPEGELFFEICTISFLKFIHSVFERAHIHHSNQGQNKSNYSCCCKNNATTFETLCSSIFNYAPFSNADARSSDPFTFFNIPITSENKRCFLVSLDRYFSDKPTSIDIFLFLISRRNK